MADPDVIVVGAGAAGLAAMRTLVERGLSAIALEARDRIGGRAWTDSETFGTPFDRGCAVGWDVVGQQLGTARGTQSLGQDHVLDRDRNPGQNARLLSSLQPLVHAARYRQRPLRREYQVRVCLRVLGFREGQCFPAQFLRRVVAPPKRVMNPIYG